MAFFKLGHKARDCKENKTRQSLNTYRALRVRPSTLRSFIPYSEDFFKCQNQRQNAVLPDVIGPANLGHFPQDSIANGLANHFGGYYNDFFIARYPERDFVIFLPEWVRVEDLVQRKLISLKEVQLRCYIWKPYQEARGSIRYYMWEPYQGARGSIISYRAWIRLARLPFECWSSHCVSAIVSSFGWVLRADDDSIRMTNLFAYRCQVTMDHLSDIQRA